MQLLSRVSRRRKKIGTLLLKWSTLLHWYVIHYGMSNHVVSGRQSRAEAKKSKSERKKSRSHCPKLPRMFLYLHV